MKRTKNVIIAGVIIAVIGVVVVLCALGASGWNLKEANNWEQGTFTAQTTVTKLNVEVSAGKVYIKRGNVDTVTVNYEYNDVYQAKIEENNGVLKIETPKKQQWINVNFWFNSAPTTEITVPTEASFEKLDLTLNAGTVEFGDGAWGAKVDVELNAGTLSMGDVKANELNVEVNAGAFKAKKIECDKFNCEISAGSTKVSLLKCDNIDLDISAGSAAITVAGAKSDYNIKASRSAGSCNVTSQTGADSSKQLKVDVSAGSASISFEN